MRAATSFDVFDAPLEGINLVEASAGTGKTWAICGVYLRLLLERKLEVQQILVVTFTKAATAELRERVRARITETLAYVRAEAPDTSDPFVATLAQTLETRGVGRDEIERRLALAVQTFDEAAILTVHGWCQRALADTPFAAGMPFAMEVEDSDTELRLEIVQDFWRRHVASDACSPELAAWLAAKRDTPQTLAALLARRLAKPLAGVRWPAAIEDRAQADVDALHAAYAAASATWTRARAEIVAMLDASPVLHAGVYKPDSIRAAAAAWDAYIDGGDPLAAIDAKKLRLCGASCLKERTRKNGRTPEHVFFDEADTLLAARERADAALARERLRLVKTLFDEAGAALQTRKRERRVVSYDDVLFNLYRALHSENDATLARSLRERFPAALIDEFQDTDPVQFGIFQAVYGTRDAPLFLVGDPKQAIYAFRHADLHTYLKAREWANAQYTLGENQRSTAGLIAAVNALFAANPDAFMLPGLDYHPVLEGRKPRKALRDDSAPRADFCVWTLPEYAGADCMPKGDARQAAARATAAEIARLLNAAADGAITYDDAPLAPGHIAVLVRTHNEGAVIKQALAELGIASVELAHESVFRTPDADDVARVLTAILEPGQTGLLRAALATELLGHDANAIAALSSDESRLMTHLQRFLGYRDTWHARGVAVMYRELLAGEGVSRRMLAREDGERRLTNLLHLGERLHISSQTHRAPDALLRWLDAQRRDETPAADVAQLRLESDQKLVQIVTIHKAKGLEYPVVFCPFVFDGYQRRDRTEGREYHDHGDAVFDFRDAVELGDEDAAIEAQIGLEGCAESLRLLYVALTRASHRCYIVAGCYAASVFGKPSPKESCRGLLNWLVAGAGRTPDRWTSGDTSAELIERAWQDFADQFAPHVACTPLPLDAGVSLVVARPSPETLHAATPPAHIASPWRIGSFSALHDGAVSESAATDHDARSDRPGELSRAASTLAPDDILRFPRGARAGECLHAAFELVDFTDDATWNDAIEAALRRHPVSLPGATPATLARMMSRMIGDVVRTELTGGIRLDVIPRKRRLTELGFNLPAHGLTANALNALLRALGYAVDRLTFARLDGYLKGYIDLVFEHEGRYYVVDWKSNHVGHSPADYDHAALDDAMAAHGYHLQALLYSVALKRYLAHRLRDYRHDEHFGGVFYLFVRGVRPDWKGVDGTATGVHFHRPEADTLARLDALLDASSDKRAGSTQRTPSPRGAGRGLG
jgi:exodeoxyribonuclease V beta subunit